MSDCSSNTWKAPKLNKCSRCGDKGIVTYIYDISHGAGVACLECGQIVISDDFNLFKGIEEWNEVNEQD